jgi:nanoRNase/pAp phosphatase (c-di-AMP/oligoRNAs hydrolase)
MAYFRQLEEKLATLLSLFKKEERWLILMNADPDALGSAMALKRIMARRVKEAAIAQINEISRPDNLAMIKYLKIPTKLLKRRLAKGYDRFALVDSQPHHNAAFKPYRFSVVIDHHPVRPEFPVDAPFVELKPDYGACSTILTEFLYNLKIRPNPALATALLYGIKSDTASFERGFVETDVKAFRYLTKYSNQLFLKKITRSEFHLSWLAYFSAAIQSMVTFDQGCFVFMGKVQNPDILVILADFFLRVHEISWNVIAGVSDKTLVIILRGDGIKVDMGQAASRLFGDIGSAGGHIGAARAEIEMKRLEGGDPKEFLVDRLCADRSPLCPDKKRQDGAREKRGPACTNTFLGA